MSQPTDDPRSAGHFDGERATLVGYLADQRLTLELKCAGLDAEQLARRAVPPSSLSLLGLVRHLAGVEQVWLRERMAGEQIRRHHRELGPDGEFDGAVGDPRLVEEAWRTWRAETAATDRYVEATADLGSCGADGWALREVLVHLVEEYARHNGHADLLREQIDGRTGE